MKLPRPVPIATRERDALCDLAESLGPDAPTLCGDWTVRDLLAHLIVRESSPLGAPGIVLPPLSGLTEATQRRVAAQDFADLVARVRTPALWSPSRLVPVEATANLLEFFVHHEDLRRAQPDWEPRVLDPGTDTALWRAIRIAGRGLVRPAGAPVVITREDTGATAELRGGAAPVVVSGPVSELVLFLYGRAQVRGLSFGGIEERIARLKAARLGL